MDVMICIAPNLAITVATAEQIGSNSSWSPSRKGISVLVTFISTYTGQYRGSDESKNC